MFASLRLGHVDFVRYTRASFAAKVQSQLRLLKHLMNVSQVYTYTYIMYRTIQLDDLIIDGFVDDEK